MKITTGICGITKVVFAVIVVFSVVLSCAVSKRSMPVEVPDGFTSNGEAGLADKWWESFQDENLDFLVEKALGDNMTLLAAWDRLDQAMAVEGAEWAALWPELKADFTISDSEHAGSYDEGTYPNIAMSDKTSYMLAFTASYELDLWGRVRASRKAAGAELSATREDLDAAEITISGEVASTWYELVEWELQIKLLENQIEINEQYLELVELRFTNGLASAADVLQQRQQLESTKGEMPLALAQRDVLQHQLAVLTGEQPGKDLGLVAEALPELPPLPDTGVPADLLLRRPDVRSSRLRLEAADYRVKEAMANRLPKIGITLSAQDQEEDLETLFDNWLKNLAVNIAVPIIDAGRRKSEVIRTRAVASERLHDFGNTVLEALLEVENALVLESRQREYVESLDQQLETAQNTLYFTRDRFRNGDTDYLPVLTALQTLQSIERQNLQARRNLVSYRIQLYRALGGGWDIERKDTDTGSEVLSDGEES